MFGEELPQNVQTTLSSCEWWRETGILELIPTWRPLSEVRKNVPKSPGIYALGLSCGLSYPKAHSRIVYIGSSDELSKRLAQHYSHPQNEAIELLMNSSAEGMLASAWPIKRLSRRWLRGFEGETLWEFERSFGTVPICNLDIPVSAASDYCDGRVLVLPCEGLENPVSLEQLAERLDRIVEVSAESPIGNPNEVVVSFGFVRDESGNVTIGQTDRYNAVRFLTAEEVASRRPDEALDEEFEEEESYAFVHQQNLAAWSIGKMSGVIDLCKRLKARKTKAKTVRPFDAPFREVPSPHSWGEVALVQARLISETWQPETNVWVKVMFGKELLGQGKLNQRWYYGEDISDLPQTPTERDICAELVSTARSILIEDDDVIREYEDGLEITRTNPTAIDRFQAEFERERQYRIAQLQARVESVFLEALNRVD